MYVALGCGLWVAWLPDHVVQLSVTSKQDTVVKWNGALGSCKARHTLWYAVAYSDTSDNVVL